MLGRWEDDQFRSFNHSSIALKFQNLNGVRAMQAVGCMSFVERFYKS